MIPDRWKLAARRKVADRYGVHSDDDDNLRGNEEHEPAELQRDDSIVSPADPTYRVVSVMSRMAMSRDEKASYLAKSGFSPRAISAILAQVDGYTESSEV